MPKSGKAAKTRECTNTGRQQEKEARTLDALIEFDQFNSSILPQLKKMILENWSTEKIRKHFAPMVQASMTMKALQGDFKAQKDLLDRHEGMAVQRVENRTIYAKMDKKELAALALQKLQDAGVIPASFKKVDDEESK
jgi:hypothetical protein